jgi:hypothetical protein
MRKSRLQSILNIRFCHVNISTPYSIILSRFYWKNLDSSRHHYPFWRKNNSYIFSNILNLSRTVRETRLSKSWFFVLTSYGVFLKVHIKFSNLAWFQKFSEYKKKLFRTREFLTHLHLRETSPNFRLR